MKIPDSYLACRCRALLFVLALALVAILPARAGVNLLVNGNWTGGENGWTRWDAYGGLTDNTGTDQWEVTNSSPIPDLTNYFTITNSYPSGAGTAYLLEGNGSFGWYQVVPYTVGSTCILSSVNWAGYIGPPSQADSWIEVDLFSTTAANTNYSAIENRLDSVPNNREDIFLKMDTYSDMNGYNGPFGWGSALDDVSSDGYGWAGGQWEDYFGDGANPGLIVSQGYIVVGLKLGWSNGTQVQNSNPAGAWAAWNNLVLQDLSTYNNSPPPSQPVFTNIAVQANGNVALTGNNGTPNGTYSVYADSNAADPFANWTQLAIGQPFDGFGNFNYTDTTTTGVKTRFYRLTVP
jgi:hypothetical protein